MTNLYMKHPNLLTHCTSVRDIQKSEKGRLSLAFAENIFRPEGGGQPQDFGKVIVADRSLDVVSVTKIDGTVWVLVEAGEAETVQVGDLALQEVDEKRRFELSKSHTLTHLMMAAASRIIADFDSKGAKISEDGSSATISFLTGALITDEHIHIIDQLTRSFVLRNAPIQYVMTKGLAECETRFTNWRIDSGLGLTGRIRVVEIEGIDANPCSGSHVTSTAEVGPYEVFRWSQSGESLVQIHARRTPCWMYWFSEGQVRPIGESV